MAAFGDALRLFAEKVERRERQVFVGSLNTIHGSVTEGSALTGAPGQPVDTGNLVNSWLETFPAQWIGEVATNVVYAPSIEDGQQPPYRTARGTQVTPNPMQFRSPVGGAHSVKLTRASWDRIVEQQVLLARST